MAYQVIQYKTIERVGHVRIIEDVRDEMEFNQLVYELSDACSAIALDKDIWVAVLSGIEKIPSSAAGYRAEGVSALSLTGPVADIEKPVIAGIHGSAVGRGLELILACDMRIAARESLFGLNQLEYGLIPFEGGTQRLARLVGKGKALEMILAGELIDSEEALRIGLINRIVPGRDLDQTLINIAREMAVKSPIALNYAKETINAGMDMTLEQGLRLEADLYMLMHTSHDRREGITAFQEKRKPKFSGD